MTSEVQQNKDSLSELIMAFLRQNEFLFEYRAQKLVYISDLVSKLKDGERVTNAVFRPYMYGTYSEDVRATLQDLSENGDIDCHLERKRGNIAKRYSVSNHRNCAPDNDVKREDSMSIVNISRHVNEAVSGQSSDELGEWSKDSWLYRNTEYGSEIDFDKINNAYEDAEAELTGQFPKLKAILSDQE